MDRRGCGWAEGKLGVFTISALLDLRLTLLRKVSSGVDKSRHHVMVCSKEYEEALVISYCELVTAGDRFRVQLSSLE